MRSANYTNGFSSSRPRLYRKDKFALTSARCDPVYPRPEIKYVDITTGDNTTPLNINNTGTDVENNPAIIPLNPLAQGVTSGTRVGQQVATKSVYYQLVFNLATPLEDAVTCVARYIVFWDRTPKAAKPVIGDLLALSSSYVTSPLNLANRDRFVVLADDRIALSPEGEQIKFIDGYRKINQLSTYTDSDTAIMPLTGGLFVLYVSDVTANYPTVYGIYRTRFMDN